MNIARLIKTFAESDQGAVTVDWTVLTGSMVGLGVAGISTISVGLSDLTADIDRSLRLMGVPDFARTLISTDTFDGGLLGEWSSTVASYEDPVLKNMMGPFRDASANPVLFRDLEFIDGTEYAVMEFDLTTVGHWEASDDMRLFVDGELIDATSLETNQDPNSVFDDGNDETQVAYTIVETRRTNSEHADERYNLAAAHDPDAAAENPQVTRSNVEKEADYTVQVVIKNPGTNMNFGIGRGKVESPFPGEAWAVDNFAVSSSIDEDDVDMDANS